jgi:hypothetical protein
MTNLVVGFYTNPDERCMYTFCRSLRRIYSPAECDLIIITNHFEPYFRDLNSIGVQFFGTVSTYSEGARKVWLSRAIKKASLAGMRLMARTGLLEAIGPDLALTYPILFESWKHPHFARWFAYQRLLMLNRHYAQVFLSDVRDVVFQAPFFSANSDDHVLLFEQDEEYGVPNCDTEWYRTAWGNFELHKVLGKQSVCIGTLIGPHAGMLCLVNTLTRFFSLYPFNGVEQAAFNYFALNDKLLCPYKIVGNISGAVATLSNTQAHAATAILNGYICRSADSSIIPVVHMYERFDDTSHAAAKMIC